MFKNIKKDLRGICWLCPDYIFYNNFCTYYNIELVAQGEEITCNNPNRIIDETFEM